MVLPRRLWGTPNVDQRSRNMVFTHGPAAHLPCLATRVGVGTIFRSSDVARFVQGGVVKTFRCATYRRASMKLKCVCGYVMTNIASPNDTEHLLVSDRSQELLQNLVDSQVSRDGIVDEWPEHWKNCNPHEVWMCSECKRLYFSPYG